ncbi:MAG: Rrf2 family transcriptional regulator [Ruminococcus flavefaciens]|nr:Rrf2 family transcriptional regulator [Ruminococcus flavefaciens]
MQISSRFTVAVHVLTYISTFEKSLKVTSDFLAGSVNVNPVVIRRLLLQLKGAELITVARGSGGASVAKSLNEITLLDVYRAVECVDGELFHFHENPNPKCPVGRNIHNILDSRLLQVQNVMENELQKITLEDVVKDADRYIQAENN